ncbi:MAG TPA: LCP family protein [Solirubrobacteraceae bacterium]|jgi:LCP family protein required for cell wall assembly|nr:LCP family protein [Solirubrobacteraceae bacterium]
MAGPDRPEYTKYRSRPSLLSRLKRDGDRVPAAAPPGPDGAPPRPGPHRPRRRITRRRVLKWLAVALAAWLGLSLLLFLVSAQIEQGKISGATEDALDSGPLPLTDASTILVLGSDTRPKGSKEPGAETSGNGRSDSILLLRVGGGANSRLSIARDTLVDVPGAGRQKINAAYAIGGAALAIRTIKGYLGIEVNHVIEVSFSEFPDLIDAMGGIDYKGGCVVAKVNGGYRRGGVTLRIRAGEKEHLNGKQALALARVRKNDCNPRENDLTRARRQQKILAAMKGRVLGVHGFVRLPWISWQTPRTFRSDMSGPTLMAVFADLATRGTPETVVLGTLSGEVPDELRRRQVERFLDG